MKIINVIASGAPILGAHSFKCVAWTAALDAIGGAAAPLIGGYVSRKNTRDTNKMNLQIAREANEMQHQLQQENNQFQRDMAIEMFNKENEYNSPVAAMSRLRAAGLNPYMGNTGSSMVQSSTGDIATPSGTAPLPVHAPSMQVEPSIIGTAFQNFKTISDAFKSISDAKKAGAERHLIEITANEQLKKLGLENESMELANAYQQIVNKYADTRQAEEVAEITRRVNNLIQQAALNAKEASYKEQLTEVQKETVKLIREDRNLKEKQKEMLIKDIDAYDVRLSMEKLFNKAAVNNQNAQAYQHREAGYLAHEQATTEDKLRQSRLDDLAEQVKNRKFERVATIVQQIMKANGIGEAPWTGVYNGVIQWRNRHKDDSDHLDINELIDEMMDKYNK